MREHMGCPLESDSPVTGNEGGISEDLHTRQNTSQNETRKKVKRNSQFSGRDLFLNWELRFTLLRVSFWDVFSTYRNSSVIPQKPSNSRKPVEPATLSRPRLSRPRRSGARRTRVDSTRELHVHCKIFYFPKIAKKIATVRKKISIFPKNFQPIRTTRRRQYKLNEKTATPRPPLKF